MIGLWQTAVSAVLREAFHCGRCLPHLWRWLTDLTTAARMPKRSAAEVMRATPSTCRLPVSSGDFPSVQVVALEHPIGNRETRPYAFLPLNVHTVSIGGAAGGRERGASGAERTNRCISLVERLSGHGQACIHIYN